MTLGFFTAMALLGLGSWGWGRLFVSRLARWGWSEAEEEISSPLCVVIGMAMFLTVSGVLLAFHVLAFGFMIAWHAVGIVLLGFSANRRRPTRIAAWTSWIRYGLLTASVALLSIAALVFPIVVTLYNPNDDDAAYLYLAKRLLVTHALIDPFNQRRLVSLGGSTLYQAFFLGFAGDNSLDVFEYAFCILMVWFLVVRTTRRRWLVAGATVIGASLIFLHGVGPVANTSPSFSGVLFSLAILQLLLLCNHRGSVKRERLLFILIGLSYGAVLTLRVYFGVALALMIVFTLLARRREIASLRNVVIIPATAFAVLVGWSISSYESTRAWFFPIFNGNYQAGFPGSSDPTLGFSGLAHRLGEVLMTGGFGNLLVVVFIIGAVFRFVWPRDRGVGDLLMIASVATVLQLVIFTKLQSGASIADMERFSAPTCLAIGLFALDSVWPTLPSQSNALLDNMRTSLDGASSTPVFLGRLFSRYWPQMMAIPLFFVVVWAALGLHQWSFYWSNFTGDVQTGTHVVNGSAGFGERYNSYFFSEYGTLNGWVPAGSGVLSATNHPYLLGMGKFRVATLDIVGNVSPPPGMPMTTPSAIAAYLVHLGYQYLAVSNDKAPGLYGIAQWQADAKSSVYEYRAWAPYFLHWNRLVLRFENSKLFHSESVGNLTLISLVPIHLATGAS